MPRLGLPVLALVLLLAGCLEENTGGPAAGEDENGDAPPAEPEPVEHRSIDAGQHAGIDGAAERVITDDRTWAAFWKDLHSRQMTPPERPNVDFTNERIVAVLIGERPNGCYGVRITNVTATEGTLHVVATEYEPAPETPCPEVMTHPYHVIVVPPEPQNVEFQQRVETGAPASE